MAHGRKHSHPSSAPVNNPHPPRRISLTPNPNHMDENIPLPPLFPSASSSEALDSNSSTSTENPTNMSQQLPFNSSPSPDPSQQGGTMGGSQHGASGSKVAGPTINIVYPGGQHPSLASNSASGPISGPLPPLPPPPLAQDQVQKPPILPAHQPGLQALFYLNTVSGGRFLPIVYGIEHITESMSDPQCQELRNAGVHLAIAFLSEDNPAMTPRPATWFSMYLLEDLSSQQELMILQHPTFSTNWTSVLKLSASLVIGRAWLVALRPPPMTITSFFSGLSCSFDTGFVGPTLVISALFPTSPAGILRCLCIAPKPLALAVVEVAVPAMVLAETALVGTVDLSMKMIIEYLPQFLSDKHNLGIIKKGEMKRVE
ncbi:hypothetical protein DFP72DRAFT_860317 [Ephemerocybe angulata]|uniref:Uncharacterized protein n=1 Tax=Ephemerocybe angulata TaxID=980116 RepID=A0A8H6H8Z2_9AGAR|nr:hypothetical protein DFP72DRAFT_860317 [Tulosesus angulatus]